MGIIENHLEVRGLVAIMVDGGQQVHHIFMREQLALRRS